MADPVWLGRCLRCKRMQRMDAGRCRHCAARLTPKLAELAHRIEHDRDFACAFYDRLDEEQKRAFLECFGSSPLR
jgi:hypothetical protein